MAALTLYAALDVLGVVLGAYLAYSLTSYLNKAEKGAFSNFLRVVRIGAALWLLNNIWHLSRMLLNFEQYVGESAEYPEYLLIIFAYLAFMLAAYQAKFISRQFEFEEAQKATSGGKK